MAEDFLVVIPADPMAELPSTADALRNALITLTGAVDARVKDYGKLQFIDAGTRTTHVLCPACMQEITADQWQDWMAEDWHGEDGFHLHRHQTLSCGHNFNLNELTYDAPQGFARWFVSAQTHGRPPLTPSELQTLERIAELELRAIAQTY